MKINQKPTQEAHNVIVLRGARAKINKGPTRQLESNKCYWYRY